MNFGSIGPGYDDTYFAPFQTIDETAFSYIGVANHSNGDTSGFGFGCL